MEQQEQLDKDRRIAELEQQVFQLSCRVTALEAVQPHMATKAEMIASRGIFNLHFGRRKRKDADPMRRIERDFHLLNLAIIPLAVILWILFFALLLIN